jgi:hypothetical protein
LVHFVFVRYIFSWFGILYLEKSGNPAWRRVLLVSSQLSEIVGSQGRIPPGYMYLGFFESYFGRVTYTTLCTTSVLHRYYYYVLCLLPKTKSGDTYTCRQSRRTPTCRRYQRNWATQSQVHFNLVTLFLESGDISPIF